MLQAVFVTALSAASAELSVPSPLITYASTWLDLADSLLFARQRQLAALALVSLLAEGTYLDLLTSFYFS